MNRLLPSAILFLAVAAGCTERPANGPGQSPAAQAQAEERSEAREGTPSIDLAPDQRLLDLNLNEPPVAKAEELTPEQRAAIDRALSRVASVELELHDGPPTFDPVEPGRYLLSIAIRLSQGRPMKQQNPCRVEVDGPDVKITLEGSAAEPILGTLTDGEFFSDPQLAPGTYGLEGRVVGPGKIRGVILPGPIPHPQVEILEGRWGLDALPLADGSVK